MGFADAVPLILNESWRILALAFLALAAAKAVSSLRPSGANQGSVKWIPWVCVALYTAILVLVVMGARGVGVEAAARIHDLASRDAVNRERMALAYSNAVRAVELRPSDLSYWRNLSIVKVRMAQFDSLLKDGPVFDALLHGTVDDDLTLRFAYCHYFLGQYDRVFPLTRRMIQANPSFPPPYVLEGTTLMAQKRYAQAQQQFLAVLRFYPVLPAAVEGLAQTYFLMGDSAGAMEVLQDTAKFPFAPPARQRFEALKVFYAQ